MNTIHPTRPFAPFFIAAFTAGSLMMASGCYPYSSEVVLCDEIPAGGCPTGRGGTCDDLSCNALYDCIDGQWQQTETCDSTTGGDTTTGSTGTGNTGTGGAGGGSSTGASTGGTGGCAPIEFDHSGEVTGCEPSLQSPDCPAVAAEQCPADICKLDCNDFYLCKKDGWVAVAYCDQDGQFFEAPR